MSTEPTETTPTPSPSSPPKTAKAPLLLVSGHAGYVHYHDREWGFPVGSDQRLFENSGVWKAFGPA